MEWNIWMEWNWIKHGMEMDHPGQRLTNNEETLISATQGHERNLANRHDHKFLDIQGCYYIAPPLMMFIIGTGICIGPEPPKGRIERQAGSPLPLPWRLPWIRRESLAKARLVVAAIQVDQRSGDGKLVPARRAR